MRKHNNSDNNNNYTNNNKKTFDTLSYELKNYIKVIKKLCNYSYYKKDVVLLRDTDTNEICHSCSK